MRTFAEKRRRIKAVRLGEDSLEELAGSVRELGNGKFLVETGLGSSVGYPGDWLVVDGAAVFLLSDGEFQEKYEEE